MTSADLDRLIRTIPDFPLPGISFKDITTLLKDPDGFRAAIDLLAEPFVDAKVDLVVGMESRGFLFAAPLAYKLNAGMVPVRKTGKLPADLISVSYSLEYGSNTLEAHRDAISPGQRVLIVDDLLATGGTVTATIGLIEQLGGIVVGLGFLIELTYLHGRENLVSPPPIVSLIQYDA
jgi:adenine phosphoribosyltransferase